MKALFVVAALIGVAAAGPNQGRYGSYLVGDTKFLSYCSKYNKNMTDTATYTRRQHRYHLNDTVIAEHNRKAARSSDPDVLILGHNFTSDLEPEEFKKLLGIDTAKAKALRTSLRDDRNDKLGWLFRQNKNY